MADNAPSQPKITVIVPTCNRAAKIEQCLVGLAAQEYSAFDVIIVDDGSTDGTPEQVKAFADAHPQLTVRCLVNETNIGANPSRNRGIAAADGEFAAFLDDDCVPFPEWLREISTPFDDPTVGVVVGGVYNVPPRNIYELTLKGTQLLPHRGPAPRILAGNMCVRRQLLLEYGLDEDRQTHAKTASGEIDMSVSGRGDEEGLYLELKAAGYQALAVPSARVSHDHPHSQRSFLRQAFRGGRSAARLVYKYHLPQRIDLLPFLAAYGILPLALWRTPFLWGALFFFALGIAAIVYNDLFRKRKTVGEVLLTFPLLLTYYHLRLAGYVKESIGLRIGRNDIKRVDLAFIPRAIHSDGGSSS
ncbi:MAG: glycosyltransferase family 2 protein [Planctomycetota bacterium]